MPITITIQGNDANEVKLLVQDLADTIAGMRTEDIPVDTAVSTVEEPVAKPAPKAAEREVAAAIEAPTVVELRAKAQEKGKTPAGKQAIKALLDEYECKSISDVPEAKRAGFLAALEAL